MKIYFYSLYILPLFYLFVNPASAQWTKSESFYGGDFSSIKSNNGDVYMHNTSSLYISIDNGLLWKRLKTPFINGGKIFFEVSPKSLFLVSDYELYRSRDKGLTWQSTTFLDLEYYETLRSIYSEGNVLFACSDLAIYVSKDDGDTWTKKYLNSDMHIHSVALLKDNFYFSLSKIGENPLIIHTSDKFQSYSISHYFGTYNVVFSFRDSLYHWDTNSKTTFSEDHGKTWKKSKLDLSIFDSLAITHKKQIFIKGDTILAFNNGKIAYTYNQGKLWKIFNLGSLKIESIINSSNIWIALSNFGVVKIDLINKAYIKIENGIDSKSIDLYATAGDSIVIFSETRNNLPSSIYFSGDNSDTWRSYKVRDFIPDSLKIYEYLRFFNGNIVLGGIAYNDQHELHLLDLGKLSSKKIISTDKNLHFDFSNVINDLYIFNYYTDSIYRYNSNTNKFAPSQNLPKHTWMLRGNKKLMYCLSGKDTSKFSISTNGGDTWMDESYRLNQFFRVDNVNIIDGITFFFSGLRIYKMTESQSTFMTELDDYSNKNELLKFQNSLIISRKGGIQFFNIQTQKIDSVLNTSPMAESGGLVFTTTTRLFRLLDNSLYYYNSKNTIAGLNEFNSNTGIKFYPNPINDYLQISGTEKIESVDIYDSKGNLILKKEGHLEKIKDVNCSSLMPGIYLFKIKSGKYVFSEKIIKQ